MSSTSHSIQFNLDPQDNHRLKTLGGHFEEHFRYIENTLGIELHSRGHHFTLLGPKKAVIKAKEAIEALYERTQETEL